MWRFIRDQVVRRRARVATLALGTLIAALSFVLLTASVSTSQLRVTGSVSQNFRAAYDILVRPPGSFTPIERSQGLIQENYLSGIFGGITLAQYRLIQGLPGVSVAAPIANIGYVAPFSFVSLPINDVLDRSSAQLYRLRLRWVANGGLSTYPDSTQFVYFTPRDPFLPDKQTPGGVEQVVGSRRLPVCTGFIKSRAPDSFSPFQLSAGTSLFCFSARTPRVQGGVIDFGPQPGRTVAALTTVFFPLLISAIDPVQEESLLKMDSTIVDGRALTPEDAPRIESVGPNSKYRVVPVIASTSTFLDETLRVAIDRLETDPRTLPTRLASDSGAYGFVSRLEGPTVGTISIPAAKIYGAFLDRLAAPATKLQISYSGYWQASPVRYRVVGSDRLSPLTVRNDANTFSTYYGAGWTPWENRDTQYRRLTYHAGSTSFRNGILGIPAIRVVGRFDPTRLPGFSRLSSVPLETYYPPSVRAANPSSERALGGRPLLPTQNVGGYVAQPPLLLTTLAGLKAFTDPESFESPNGAAPISVIRVRVSGVAGADPLSRARIQQVAQEIYQATGLAVDITAGSSPRPITVDLPPGKFGAPRLTVSEGWVQKGVAVRFLDAVDGKSLGLFVIVLVLCSLFLLNAVTANVRTRRTEIGILRCLGWSRSHVFAAILGEVLIIGMVAGVAGTLVAVVLAVAFDLQLGLWRDLLVTPIAMAVALVGGAWPAWRASLGSPIEVVRPLASGGGRGVAVRGVLSLALSDVLRLPARTMFGAAGLLLGVAALTVLTAVNQAFSHVLVGTLLGRFVSLQVRGVDLLSVWITILLGSLMVADVIFLNVRERGIELAALRTSGWSKGHLRLLVALEALSIGAIGSFLGVAVGVLLGSAVRGVPLNSVLNAALAAGISGVVLAGMASILPLAAVEGLSPVGLLAEE